MKKTLTCAILAMLFSASQAWAQSNKGNQDESLAEKVSSIMKKAKSSMQRAGKRLEKVIGLNEKGREGDEVKIDGTYYMPIYSLNIYEGKDAEKFKKTSEKLFAKKYPHTNIVSVTIPQEGWVSESVKDGSKVIGYLQYMYCYVLAKDGDDGYINARFSFQRYKDVGKEYGIVNGRWPKWDRTDVIPLPVYNELKDY